MRVSKENLALTQTASLLHTLSWVQHFVSCIEKDDSILFLRCDCILKSYFHVDDWIKLMHRQDKCNRSMLFPFYVFKDGGPADQIFLLPLELWAAFDTALQRLSQKKPRSLHAKSLHYLHEKKYMGSKVAYFIETLADANSEKEWNPFYVILGRDSKLRKVEIKKWDKVLQATNKTNNTSMSRTALPNLRRTCDYCWRVTHTMACAECNSWSCEVCNFWCSRKWHGCGTVRCLECNRRTKVICEIRPRIWKCHSCVGTESRRCLKKRRIR